MELQGKIIVALDPRSGTSARGEWISQDFVLETHDTYPKKMVFSVWGADRLQRFGIQVGQEVNVSFDIDAREYNGRWFNSIRAFDVRPVQQQAASEAPVQAPQFGAAPEPAVQPPFAQDNTGDSTDDLPF